MWTTFTGELTGPYHRRKNEESQDSLGFYQEGSLSVIVAADGAGSHERSKEGSQLAVDYVLEYVKLNVTAHGVSKAFLEFLAEDLHEMFLGQEHYRTMGCTVAVALSDGPRWASLVIGDAFAVIHKTLDDHVLIQPKDNFEFANVTELLSNKTIHPAVEEGEELIAMTVSTDGLYNRSVSNQTGPIPGFWRPLLQRAQQGVLDLNDFLSYLDSKHFIDDDTTLAISLQEESA